MEGEPRRGPHRARVLHLQAERLIDDFFGSGARKALGQPRTWEPRADVYETEEGLVIQVELSAVARDSVALSIEGQRLVLRGTRCAPLAEPQVRYHQMEIPCGTFERIFQLPPQVSTEHIRAMLKEGLLTITLSKSA